MKTALPAATRTLTVGAGADCTTLEAALDRVAEIRKTDTTTPLAVLVAPGDYAPARPLAITHRHAQTNRAPLTVSAVDFVRKPQLKPKSTLIRKLAHGRLSDTFDGAVQLTLKVFRTEGLNIRETIIKEAREAFE